MTPRQTRRTAAGAAPHGRFLKPISKNCASFVRQRPCAAPHGAGRNAASRPRPECDALANAAPTRQARPRQSRQAEADEAPWPGCAMKPSGTLLAVALALTGAAGPLAARRPRTSTEPIEVAELALHRDLQPDVLSGTTKPTSCASARRPARRAAPITGGLTHRSRATASLRILESYPRRRVLGDARRSTARRPENVAVRCRCGGFALCLLPAARKAVGHADAAFQAARMSSTPVRRCRRGFAERDRPPGLPAWRARRSPAASGSTRNTEGPRAPRLELSYPDPNGWNVSGGQRRQPQPDPPPKCAPTPSASATKRRAPTSATSRRACLRRPGRRRESRQRRRAWQSRRLRRRRAPMCWPAALRTVKRTRRAIVEMQESFPDIAGKLDGRA